MRVEGLPLLRTITPIPEKWDLLQPRHSFLELQVEVFNTCRHVRHIQRELTRALYKYMDTNDEPTSLASAWNRTLKGRGSSRLPPSFSREYSTEVFPVHWLGSFKDFTLNLDPWNAATPLNGTFWIRGSVCCTTINTVHELPLIWTPEMWPALYWGHFEKKVPKYAL